MDMSISATAGFDPTTAVPMYRQIANHLAGQIKSRALAPGTKLPPERQLAELYRVSRTTAINAYRRLEEEGLVRTRVGSGTYVAEGPAETSVQPMPWHQFLVPPLNNPLVGILRELVAMDMAEGAISLATGMPDPGLYPWPTFQTLLSGRQLEPADLGYISTEGYYPLREALAARHSRQGAAVKPENVAIMAGSQQGLYLLAKALLSPGDYVVIEAPTYLGALQIFQAAGARLLTLPAGGPLPLDILEDYLVRYRPKLLYLLPTFQNPCGRVMPPTERQALLALAARHRLAIIEDDPYGELYYDQVPPPSLKAHDEHGRVIYLGTFSKIVFPGLRAGWVAGPEAVIHRLSLEKQYVDLHSNNLAQWMLWQFMIDGLFDTHLDRVRAEYRRRRNAMAQALKKHFGDRLSYVVPGGGFYFWCRLADPRISCRELLTEAGRQGVNFVPGDAFYPDGDGRRDFRLCFATKDADSLQEGVRRLARALSVVEKSRGPASGKPARTLAPLI
jgi:DNA-binding transcriptional MocR family regulator